MSETIPGLPLEGTILETLGIRPVVAETDLVVLEMDVDHTVHQPMGLLHGGASAVIAETAASIGAFLNCDPATQYARRDRAEHQPPTRQERWDADGDGNTGAQGPDPSGMGHRARR